MITHRAAKTACINLSLTHNIAIIARRDPITEIRPTFTAFAVGRAATPLVIAGWPQCPGPLLRGPFRQWQLISRCLAVRLMADLGWNPANTRDMVELTMPPTRPDGNG